jgi:YfiH family protein
MMKNATILPFSNKESPSILAAANLDSLPRVHHGFFTSAWGDCGFNHAQPEANRRRVAQALHVMAENLLSCYQIHSPDVVVIEKPWASAERPKADAMVTKTSGIALGILTADCVPILFADESAGVIGAAHAGWRGALSGVIENTIAAMVKLGAQPRKIHAALGACIAQNSYEVGAEFPAPFLAEDPAHEKFFRPAMRDDHFMFDLPAYVTQKLRKAGVISIEAPPADTCADAERFFSYRRACLQGKIRDGSLISCIALKE